MENTIDNTKPGCPKCGKEPRFCIKQGPAYRKKSEKVEVQVYQCKGCGYKGRGKMFHMTEEMGIEKEEAMNIKIEPVVSNNDSD